MMICVSIAAVFLYMTILFAVAQAKKNFSIVDIAWGGGFILLGIVNGILSPEWTLRQTAVSILVAVWGLRLIAHIGSRNKGKAEDYRYRQMRERWGKNAGRKAFVNIFMLQGFILLVVGVPLILVHANPKPGWNWIDTLGLAVWVKGFVFETVADWQLSRFIRSKTKERTIMTSGLWSFSRHPNYYGEVLVWWGIYLVLVSIPWGWAGIVSPLLISVLLLKVSGVPLLEKRYEGNEAFQAYARQTSKFIPLPKKKNR